MGKAASDLLPEPPELPDENLLTNQLLKRGVRNQDRSPRVIKAIGRQVSKKKTVDGDIIQGFLKNLGLGGPWNNVLER